MGGGVAQGPAESDRALVSDRVGDVVLSGDIPNQTAGDQFAYVDIVEAWLGPEGADVVEIGARMAALDPPAGNERLARENFWYFSYDTLLYRASLDLRKTCRGDLAVFNATRGVYRSLRCLDPQVDAATKSVRLGLPTTLVTDRNGVPLHEGRSLENFRADSFVRLTTPGSGPGYELRGIYAHDRAPDASFGPPFQAGRGSNETSGHLKLVAEDPIRVSNGESTTLVFRVGLVSEGRDDAVHMAVENAEPSFTIRVPERLEAKAGVLTTFPVILSMNFTHRHGETAKFRVVAQSIGAPDVRASASLGVYWTETPQPAGHHNVLWFHSKPASPSSRITDQVYGTTHGLSQASMNPMQKDSDPGAKDAPVPAYLRPLDNTSRASRPVADWHLSLVPSLLIGLDFDVNRTAELETKVATTFPATKAELEADLRYCVPGKTTRFPPEDAGDDCQGDWSVVASGRSAPRALSGNREEAFQVKLAPQADADLLPFVKGSNLQLRLRFITDVPQNLGGPQPRAELVVAGSTLTLPLLEYHDPVEQAFSKVGSIGLAPVGLAEKAVNPGRTTVFSFRVTNAGATPDSVSLTLEGQNVEWARIVDDTRIELSPNQGATFRIAVDAPETAAPGERAELFVVATAERDTNVVAVSRFRASVVDVEVQPIPDEQAIPASASEGAPGFEAAAWLLVSAVAVASLRIRRRW